MRKQSRVTTLFLFIFLMLGGLIYLFSPALPPRPSRNIKVAAAKGRVVAAHMLHISSAELTLKTSAELAPALSHLLAGKRTDYLYSTQLGSAETANYPTCDPQQCLQLTYYNYSDGGTIETIYNPQSDQTITTWQDPDARPGPSPLLVEKIVDIAAVDERVLNVLGNIRKAQTAMVPTSTWLRDDACRDDWCVDLTFHDPAQSGRIFHIVVNLNAEQVARTFFTRARSERAYQAPPELDPSAPPFTDGCHDGDNWHVCWEMTDHDGLNFFDARYNNTDIFSSIKIGQVEAFYRSWPGGYRDEIGKKASVPPVFDTRVTQKPTGFEVRQMFTEKFNWPNCICCYRYEQVIDFYDDGQFDLSFVSHGPGCDEWAEYRPFWRIDIDLNGESGDETWVWREKAWEKAFSEVDLDLFSSLGPADQLIATFDDDLHYRWQPQRTDPLGQDSGRLFVLQEAENEGEAAIAAGPADTFQPPSQWVDGNSLNAGRSVIWYVPVLKTKKGEPWWCAPDPEPAVTPCNAVMHIIPAGELTQLTAEELALLQATPTAIPTSEDGAVSEAPVIVTPRPIAGEDAEQIILNSGCGACHAIGTLGEAGKVGPDLSQIGTLASQRVPGQSAEEYLRNSLLYPDLFLAPGCPNGDCLPHIMPADYFARLNEAQLQTIIDFLLEQKAPIPIASEPTKAPLNAPTPISEAGDKNGSRPSQSFNPLLFLPALAVIAIAILLLRRKK